MPELTYIVAVLVVVFAITFALRAVPFAVIKPLRESTFVSTMARWMPAGILAVLAASTFATAATGSGIQLIQALAAAGITIAIHLLFGRRTLLSVGLGTLTFVALVNFL